MSKQNFTVYEYDRLWAHKELTSVNESTKDELTERDFKELRSFILKQEEGVGESMTFQEFETEKAAACMKLSADKTGKEVLTVQNYVGTIMLSTGTTIEILPKLFRNGNAGGNASESARRLVVEMLKACGIITYKSFQNANLRYEKMPIFEVYIRIFLNEIFDLYKKGLKSGYEVKQENEKFLKGKLLFSQHIKYNFAHAERFYVEYDEFSVNRPENRLIKTTLERLRRVAKTEENKRDLRRLVMIFDGVERSTHIDSDFQKCTGGRNMQEYESILSFCKMFLHGLSYSTYAGKHDTLALLFPMEKLFEGYIAKKIQQQMPDWKIITQKKGKYLFTEPKMFLLKPDVYLQKGDDVVLMDTKWKLLSDERSKNYGISQADMYQMYAYYNRYDNVKRVILVYPYPNVEIEDLDFGINKQTVISARFVKCEENEFDVTQLANEIVSIVSSKSEGGNLAESE